MHALIVLAHPEPASFNAHLKDIARATLENLGHTVEVSDLYAQGFDACEAGRHFRAPVDPDRFDPQAEQRHAYEQGTLPPDVEAELARLERADFVLLQYPMWWFSVPAMLKGWFDRVFVYGLYTSRLRYDAGHFRGKRAMLSLTTGGPEATFAHNGRNGDIELLLWPLHFTLYYMGFSVLPPAVAYGVEGGLKYSPEDEAAARLRAHAAALAARLRALDEARPLPFSGWDDWDAEGRLKPGVAGHSPFMRAEP